MTIIILDPRDAAGFCGDGRATGFHYEIYETYDGVIIIVCPPPYKLSPLCEFVVRALSLSGL